MPCPTCDHTMHLLVTDPNGIRIHHCPRCGTVSSGEYDAEPSVYVPKLVERCRKFEVLVIEGYSKGPECWNKLGIRESINTPENRS